MPRLLDPFWLALASHLVFAKIRDRIGSDLRALICGSAPLAVESQRFFEMIGIPVLQVYGLTETTAICTMDNVRQVTAGRVGPAIQGIQMRLSGQGEILVMGPNIFPGYWNRPPADSEVFQEGWFRTGDQGEVDTRGNWKIVGRMKNIIITTGGHNISPEPMEQRLLEALPASTQVMVVGNGRKYLAALLTEPVSREAAARVIEACQPATAALPSDPPVSYRRRAFQRRKRPACRQRKAAKSGHRVPFPGRDRGSLPV